MSQINFSAFSEEGRYGQIEEATARGDVVKCGWIPREEMTSEEKATHDAIVGAMPEFKIHGAFSGAEQRYPLWKAALNLFGKHHSYNHQILGSCVGAAGGNMAKTAQVVEIVIKGEREEYKELWWPFTYGRSRLRGGLRGRGEGSFGSSWAEAATKDGFFEVDPVGAPDLPDFKNVNGWLQLTSKVEMDWSDGAAIGVEPWISLAKKHLFPTVARARNADDVTNGLINGYAGTCASSFGMRNMEPRVVGSPGVRIGEWTGTWQHQMSITEYYSHPTEGDLYYIQNNWGDCHGDPTQGEPPGGFYVRRKTMDEICRTGEVYMFSSSFQGFVARELNFSAF